MTVAPGSREWTVVYVRQNNDFKTLYAIWNSGKTGYELSGKVLATACSLTAPTCSSRPSPAPGVTVTASGVGGSSAMTNDMGKYSITLPEGKYEVTPSGGDRSFAPTSRSIDLHADTSGVDFKTCLDAGGPTRSFASAGGVSFSGDGGNTCPKWSVTLLWTGPSMQLVTWTFPYKCGDKTKLTATGGAGDSGVINNATGHFYIGMAKTNQFSAHISGSFKTSKGAQTIVVDSAEVAFDSHPAGCPSGATLSGTLVLHKF